MSLSIQQLRFDDFRGYRTLELPDLTHLTVLVGCNAVGKTNLIEGIQLLTSGESFRKPGWGEVVSWGAERAVLRLTLGDGKRVLEHRLVVQDGGRTYEVNGKRKSAHALRGACPSVLFIPDDLQMVKAASARRRDAADALGAQLSKGYAALKADYQQTLRQRNLLIRDGVHVGPLFDSWDENLCVNGARLCVNRQRLFERIGAHMARIYPRLVPGEQLRCAYLPSWARFDEQGRQRADIAQLEQVPTTEVTLEGAQERLAQASRELATMELQRKTSLVGPHKDELAFYLNGRNARLYASQGQQRTIVLAWKLAEVALVNEFIGQDPILLLDDVMSELDGARRDALTTFIESSAQTFITTTNLGYFSPELLAQARVVELPLEGTRYEY